MTSTRNAATRRSSVSVQQNQSTETAVPVVCPYLVGDESEQQHVYVKITDISSGEEGK